MYQTDQQLLVRAAQVADETAPGANTAERVGELFEDYVESKQNIGDKSTDVTADAASDVKYPSAKAVATAIAAAALPYKMFIAKLSQSGTGIPTSISPTGGNTTGATFTYSRAGAGYFDITANSAIFTTGKTFIFINGSGLGGYVDPKIFATELNFSSPTTKIDLGVFRLSDGVAEDGFELNIQIIIFN